MLDEIKSANKNISLIKSVLVNCKTEKEMHDSLDKLLNTTEIFYCSRDDYEKNFPQADDLEGKINLIISRRK